MIDDLIADVFADKSCTNCLHCPLNKNLMPCYSKRKCIKKSAWQPNEEYLKELTIMVGEAFKNAKRIPNYNKEMKIIHEALENRLIEKHEIYKNTWKYVSMKYLRVRIKKIYKLLEQSWKNNNINEEKKLIDIANQAMLLYLRLIISKK